MRTHKGVTYQVDVPLWRRRVTTAYMTDTTPWMLEPGGAIGVVPDPGDQLAAILNAIVDEANEAAKP